MRYAATDPVYVAMRIIPKNACAQKMILPPIVMGALSGPAKKAWVCVGGGEVIRLGEERRSGEGYATWPSLCKSHCVLMQGMNTHLS